MSKKIQRSFLVPPDLDKRLGHAAVEAGIDKSTAIVKALEFYLPILEASTSSKVEEAIAS